MKLLSKQYQFNQYLNRWVNEFEIIETEEYIQGCYIPSNFDDTTYVKYYTGADIQCEDKYKVWNTDRTDYREMTDIEKARKDFEDDWKYTSEKYRLIGDYDLLKYYGSAFMSDLVVKRIINEYHVNNNTLHVFLNIIKPADLAALKQIPTVTIQDFDTEQYL